MRHPRPLVLSLLAALVATSLAAGQNPPPREFSGDQEVTAVDLLVEVDFAGPLLAEATRRQALSPEDFSVELDGEPRPVVGLDNPDLPETWQIVLYFDARLASEQEVAWAAGLLAESPNTLTALGEVEIVVASPRPATRLPATRNAAALEQALSGMAARPTGGNQIVGLRAEALRAFRQGDLEEDEKAVFLRRVANEERKLVEEQVDRLLSWLVDARSASSRHCVFVVSGGFDERPEAFYGGIVTAAGPLEPSGDQLLEGALQSVASIAASYGWIVVPMLAPPPPGPPKGVTVGRVRMRGLRGEVEEDRRPQRARAFLELAEALIGQGKGKDAEDALRQAIHYFGDFEPNAEEQASATIQLAKLLEGRGDVQGAQRYFVAGRDLDSAVATRLGAAPAELLAPAAALETWATESSGFLVRNTDLLTAAVESLGRRRRVTFQQSGPPDGALHRVDVEPTKATLRLRAPRWSRHGTPPAVPELRVRQLLRGEAPDGDLRVGALSSVDLEHGAVLRAAARRSDASVKPPLRPRWTVAAVSEYGDLLFLLHPEARGKELTLPLDEPLAAWLALVADEPESGSWGGTVVDLGRD